MQPVYIDLHIHTYPDANNRSTDYDVATLVRKIKEYNGDEPFLISFTDHNTINKDAYLAAKAIEVNLLLGAELHIKNHDDVEAFHCHIYFNLDVTEENIKALNDILDKLYTNKLPCKTDQSIPDIQKVINAFDPFEFMLLPHAGQRHGQFNYSLHEGEQVDNAISRSIYYNQFDGFTAREDKGLEATREYFAKLGIAEFVNLLTCSDNYVPSRYPEPKSCEASPFVPTWMMAEPTYDGVRLSLSESSRLFYQKEKPQIQCDHIGKVKLSNELIDIDVELTEGLNVVIGGSSSGKTLVEPVCQASLIKVKSTQDGDDANLLAFMNPNSQNRRNFMTVKLSEDEGQTWPRSIMLYAPDGCGYSALAKIDGDTVGALYETSGGLMYQTVKLSDAK